jgi:hypothetical protein
MAVGEPPPWLRNALYPQELALTSPTSGGRSVGIVRSRTEATEFVLVIVTPSTNCIVLWTISSYCLSEPAKTLRLHLALPDCEVCKDNRLQVWLKRRQVNWITCPLNFILVSSGVCISWNQSYVFQIYLNVQELIGPLDYDTDCRYYCSIKFTVKFSLNYLST